MKTHLVSAIFFLVAGSATAQHAHDTSLPQEPGQSAFAAMAEIVEMLRVDPHTDWSKVNIPALQEHLVDMEMLLTEAVATTAMVDGGAQFDVSGSPRAIAAVRRMAPAHAPFLDTETGWQTAVEVSDTGVVVTVIGNAEKIAALGFHGIMTIGAHHQQHHLAIATGQSPH